MLNKILIAFLSLAAVTTVFGQNTVMVNNSNATITYPLNFWSANAVQGRAGLGLGSAATNSAAAFQPSALTLSNLASNNAVNLTNLQATNIVGVILPSNLPAGLSLVVSITNGGTGATNAATARTNLGLPWSGLTNASAAGFQTALFSGAAINSQGQKITNLGTPTISNEAATKAYVDSLFFRTPPAITSFIATSGGVSTFEIGTTISNVSLIWTITPTNVILTSQVLSPSIGSIDVSLRTTNLTGLSLTSNTTWTNVINDGLGFNNSIVTNSSASIAFRHYLSWGRSSLTNLGNSEIQSLHTTGGGAGRDFATARQKTGISMTVSNQYVYFAYPASFGTATFRVNGFPNSAFTNTTVSYTNASGNVTSFLIYRTIDPQTGDSIPYEIQ
jgi:hypothetical protein